MLTISHQIIMLIFELQELLFHGVMRFYFQEPGTGQKVATKCIRVASDATSQAVIETLIEKFRPDMRMLSVPEYALYEIHENGGNPFVLYIYLILLLLFTILNLEINLYLFFKRSYLNFFYSHR